MILGGINSNYNLSNKVHILDISTFKWHSLDNMINPRTFNQSCFIKDDLLYVIGGNTECSSEIYSFKYNEWRLIDSYRNCIKNFKSNELYNFSFATNYINE